MPKTEGKNSHKTDSERPLGVHYTVGRAAYLLDKGPRWIKEKIKDGVLDGYRLDGEIVVTLASINAYLDMCRITGSDAEDDEGRDVQR